MEQVLRNTKMEHCITEQNIHLAFKQMTERTASNNNHTHTKNISISKYQL